MWFTEATIDLPYKKKNNHKCLQAFILRNPNP